MDLSGFVVQLLNGLAGASSLFLVGAGLSLIFGVTRIVNFAHGSFYMLGLYGAVALTDAWGAGPLGFWGGVLMSAVAVAALGALIEVVVLRRLYSAPELYQLLATFALVLVIRDAALRAWGPEDLLGPKAPALKGAIDILGKPFPSYDVLSIFMWPPCPPVLPSSRRAGRTPPGGPPGRSPGRTRSASPRPGSRAPRSRGASARAGPAKARRRSPLPRVA